MFYNQGEACTSTARILVHESIYDDFVERFARGAEALVVGDPLDAAHRHRADGRRRASASGCWTTSSIGLEEGARLVAQGALPDATQPARRVLGRADGVRRRHARMRLAPGGDLRPDRLRDALPDEDEAVEIANGTTTA